ncbi:MAG: GAF domain-containing protein [Anaerolineales bacterium]|nr:GAF domain-containing protein [Anaerolineales bacterium]
MDDRYTAALQRQLEELRILHAAASACVEATDEGGLLKLISDLIGEQLFPEEFGVLMLDEQNGELRLHSSYRGGPENFQNIVIPLGKGVTGRVAQTGLPLRIGDVSQEPDFINFFTDISPQSELCVPIRLGDKVIGVFNAQSTDFDAYTEADQQLLTTVAGQLAIAIEHLRADSAERLRSKQLEAIYQASQEIAASLDLHQIYATTHRTTSQLMPADVFVIGLVDENTQQVDIVYFWDREGFTGISSLPPGKGLTGQVLASGQPLLINDVEQWSDRITYLGPPPYVRSIIMVPVAHGGKVLGVLTAQSYDPYTYTEEDQRTLSLLANQTAIAIENARLFSETQRRLSEVTLLSQVITQTASSDDLPSALNDICADVAHYFNAPQAAFALLNTEGTQAEVVVEFRDESRPSALGAVIPVENNPSMQNILAQKKTIAIEDAQNDPQLAPIHDLMRMRGVVSLLIVPILIGDEVVGTLGIDLLNEHTFTQNELSLVQNVANQIGQALDRVRLFIAAREHANRMAHLAQISAELNRSFTINEVLENIGKGVVSLNDADFAVIYCENQDGFLSCPWSSGLSQAYIDEALDLWREPFIDNLRRQIEPYLIFDLSKWEAPDSIISLMSSQGIRGAGFWPVTYEGEGLVVIGCYYKKPHAWQETQQETMHTFTRQAAAALQNARLFEETRRRAAQQEALNAIIASAASSLDTNTLVQSTLDFILNALNLDNGGIWLENVVCLRNLPEAQVLPQFAELSQKTSIIPGKVFIVEDWRRVDFDQSLENLADLVEQFGIRASLIVPLVIKDKHIGGMSLNSNAPRQWLAEEIALAEAVGRQLGSSIERLDLLERTREQARQVQQIIDTVPEGVILLDEERRILLANPVARKYLKELAGDIQVGDKLVSLAGLSLDKVLSRESQWIEMHTQAMSTHTFEVIAQLLDSALPPSQWVLVLRDVSQERENQKRIQMQERLATVGQLAAGIAHDFNNIMAAIVVYTDLLMLETQLSQGGQERLAIIHKQIQRASSLIRQILDFSRRSVMEQSTLDLLPFIKELQKLLGRVLPENIHLHLDFQEGEYMLRADPTRLQQVFINLALNARDAMPSGGELCFKIDRLQLGHNEPLPLPDLFPGDWMRVEVADTGRGIASEDLPHIFEPFYTTKPVGEGTGLGLAQVYGIVKQHGGAIDVQSQAQGGTKFIVYLPILEAIEDDILAEHLPPLQSSGKGERVLLVEDDPTACKALEIVLETLNFQPVTAANGEEALTLLSKDTQDIKLIVSDIVMPVMGGLELYRRLEKNSSQYKFLFVTGHPMDVENQALLEIGQVNWLQKPFTITEFSQAIQKIMDEP